MLYNEASCSKIDVADAATVRYETFHRIVEKNMNDKECEVEILKLPASEQDWMIQKLTMLFAYRASSEYIKTSEEDLEICREMASKINGFTTFYTRRQRVMMCKHCRRVDFVRMSHEQRVLRLEEMLASEARMEKCSSRLYGDFCFADRCRDRRGGERTHLQSHNLQVAPVEPRAVVLSASRRQTDHGAGASLLHDQGGAITSSCGRRTQKTSDFRTAVRDHPEL